MAVPKKKMSKSKTNSRNSVWKRKAVKQAEKAVSLYKAIISKKSNFQWFNSDGLIQQTNKIEE